MPLIDRPGRFRATVLDIAMRPQKAGSRVVMVGCQFAITEALILNKWEDWSAHQFEFYGNFCLVTKDGAINETGVEQLRDGLGWDGSVTSIDDGTFQPSPCQIVVKAHEYKGRTSYRAEWIDHFDFAGGMRRAEPAEVAGFNAQHGAALRAICGTRAAMPPKPVAPAPVVPAPVATTTRDDAWAAFKAEQAKLNAQKPNSISDEKLTEEWAEAIARHKKPEAEFTGDDWQSMATDGAQEIEIPF